MLSVVEKYEERARRLAIFSPEVLMIAMLSKLETSESLKIFQQSFIKCFFNKEKEPLNCIIFAA